MTTVPGPPRPSLAVGDVLRYQQLGSLGTYRLVGSQGDLYELEVIDVPGLSAGQRFRFTSAAVARMENVSSGAAQPERRVEFEPGPVELGPGRVVERPTTA